MNTKAIVLFVLFLLVHFYVQAGVPTITSFSPTKGIIGTSVTITGTGFSTIADNNIVYFGAVKAKVNTSTTTSITVTVPAGAGSVVPVCVTVGRLTAYSAASTTPTFNLTNSPILSPKYATLSYFMGEGYWPHSVSIGDFNDDSKSDIAIVNEGSNKVCVFLGDGKGSFGTKTDFALGSSPVSIAIGDFNGDGKADLAAANGNDHTISILIGNATGGFGPKTDVTVGSYPYSIAISDFNCDGNADLAVGYNGNSYMVSLLLGDGTGKFGPKTDFLVGNCPISIAVGDFNGDRKVDMVSLNYMSNTASVLLGNGDGSFKNKTDLSVGKNPQSVAIGDLNGDGNPDLTISNSGSNNVSCLLGDGLGGFGTKSDFLVGKSPASVVIGDYNGDGKLDLATANYGSNDASILLGDGVGGFGTKIDFPLGTAPYSIVVGDFNGDGKADLVSANHDSRSASILIYSVQASLTTETITDTTISSATFHGSISNLGDSTPTSYGFCWSTKGSPTIADSKINKGAVSTTGAFTASIKGLSSGTTYHVRAFATNAAGTSYGNEVIFTTLPFYISSFSPTKGVIGTLVTVTGIGFSTTAANNIVYFGAVKAKVNTSTSTSIIVTVPAGAGSVFPVSVTVGGLTAFSVTSKTPTFNLTNTPSLIPDYAINAYSTGTKPSSLAIGDFNGDCNPDLAVANFLSGDISVFLGNGKGSFGAKTNYYVEAYGYSLAIGDFNGDGNADLILTSGANSRGSVLLGDGKGKFGTKTDFSLGYNPVSVGICDFNRDGKADLVVANNDSFNISILLGNGDNSFGIDNKIGVGKNPQSVSYGDFNSDGKADLAIANNLSNTISVLIGNGDGSFSTTTNLPVGKNPQSVAIGDFNGDGKLDMATANSGSNNVSILLGNGAGGFETKTDFAVGTVPYSVAVGDFNGDGKLDMTTANSGSNNISILLGDGVGGFGTKIDFPVGTAPYSVAVGDFNGDGKADIVSANSGSNNVSVLHYPVPTAVTTKAVINISANDATGDGTITDLGIPNLTSYGFCWNINGTPTTADNKIDKGAVSATGAFTSAITGLSQTTTYHVRAYATNATGTTYGNEVIFTSLATYPVTFSAVDANGTISALVNSIAITSGDQVVQGKDVIFKATPIFGYKVKQWTLNGAVISENISNTYTHTGLSAASIVTVAFEQITYPVSFSTSDANGTLEALVNSQTITSGDKVVQGKDIVFKATPALGYKVKQWTLNGTAISGNTSNSNKLTDLSAALSVTVVFELITGINNISETADFEVFPNPIQSVINIMCLSEMSTVEILRISGEIVQKIDVEKSHSLTFPVKHLTTGVYLVRVLDVNGKVSNKIMIKK